MCSLQAMRLQKIVATGLSWYVFWGPTSCSFHKRSYFAIALADWNHSCFAGILSLLSSISFSGQMPQGRPTHSLFLEQDSCPWRPSFNFKDPCHLWEPLAFYAPLNFQYLMKVNIPDHQERLLLTRHCSTRSANASNTKCALSTAPRAPWQIISCSKDQSLYLIHPTMKCQALAFMN